MIIAKVGVKNNIAPLKVKTIQQQHTVADSR